MSKKKTLTEEEVEPAPPSQSVTAPIPSKAVAKQKQVTGLVKRLTEISTQLVLKVAVCNCNHKNECELYLKAREIAEVIDKLQSIRR